MAIDESLARLLRAFQDLGARTVLCKPLSPNDNSKNQIYLGPDLSAVNMLPTAPIVAESGENGRTRFKAGLDLWWLGPEGAPEAAPTAQLILYPQYPEVRMSGFLLRCRTAPSATLTSRREGRLLFLAIDGTTRIYAYAVEPDTPIAREFAALGRPEETGVFLYVPLLAAAGATSRDRLVAELRRISGLGWIRSKRLLGSGELGPCEAPNCGGYTLEAELGVLPNGRAEPDFEDWEVKQYAVRDLEKPQTGVITLMTPEPTGGLYREIGAADFVRRFGRPEAKCEAVLYFCGNHRCGARQDRTGLTLRVRGFDAAAGKITDAAGAVELRTDDDELAASWGFASLLDHWKRKHARAVYVPSISRPSPRSYRYGATIRLAERTDVARFLGGLASGAVYYDPGVRLDTSSARGRVHARSQFRTRTTSIEDLYLRVDSVNVAAE